jgi:hypothetical protein
MELYILDSGTRNYILWELNFSGLLRKEKEILWSSLYDASIIGSVRTTIILPKSAQLMRENTLLYPGLTCTLLCYKDIRKNGLHVEIHVDGKE